MVDAQLNVSINGEPAKSMRVVNRVGAPFAVKSDGGAKSWEGVFVARPVEGGAIELQGTIHRGDKILGKSVIVVKPGQAGAIRVEGPDSPGSFRMEATLALHEAGWKLPLADRGSAAGSSPVEN